MGPFILQVEMGEKNPNLVGTLEKKFSLFGNFENSAERCLEISLRFTQCPKH